MSNEFLASQTAGFSGYVLLKAPYYASRMADGHPSLPKHKAEQNSYGHKDTSLYDLSGKTSYMSHSGSSSSGEPCCPLVVDPLLLVMTLAFIAAATYFLRSMNLK